MILFVLAYLGGVLTIVSPCILPVLPFVFARADRPFVKSGLPLLVGMAATFALIATLAAVGGGWAVQANTWGRYIAIALLALFGLTLLFPALSDRLTRPLVALGARLSESADQGARSGGATVWPSLLLGVATGLLWAPCAGPVLGLILTGAALQGASARTSLLLLVYALGAATSLALALLVGGKVFAAMKRSLGVSERIRQALGVLVLLAVVGIAFGLDTRFLTRISAASTTSLEQGLINGFGAAPKQAAASNAEGVLSYEGPAPSLEGATAWINSPPLKMEDLRGKVVLVDFWTYSCINCLRAAPYIEAWAEKYRDQGLVVIGVHAPEFAFEKNLANVRKAVADLKIGYPVAVDNDAIIWQAFENNAWPAHYFIDAQGNVRYHSFGEGGYDVDEKVIQSLLAEAGHRAAPGGLVQVRGAGAQAAANFAEVKSPETYLGYGRAERFLSVETKTPDAPHVYADHPTQLNDWGLTGDWTVAQESVTANAAGASVVYRFHARDLHMVLGPGKPGKPVRFQVTVDGKPPGGDHGVDTDAAGAGVVTSQRLYQLIRQKGAVADHTFEIRFLDPGVQAYTFTFG